MPSATDGEALYRYEPDYAVAPGEILAEYLEENDMTQVDLSRRLGISLKHVNQLINGAVSLSTEIAVLLERVTGVPARLWNNLEANYQDQRARHAETEALAADVGLLDEIPLAELIRQNYVPDARSDRIAQLRHVLAFFRVANRASFHEVCTSAAYRGSKAFTSNPGAVAAWLRIGENEAAGRPAAPYRKTAFRAALVQIRALTREHDPSRWQEPLVQLCADAGVLVVFVPEIGRTHLNGAARWLSPDKALIQLSLRYKWADIFWFSFFHEAAHILLHSKKRTFIDADRDDRDGLEQEADTFAADTLIPPEHHLALAKLRTERDVRAFAAELGIGTSIVVGRLKHEKLVPQSWFNSPALRPRYELQ